MLFSAKAKGYFMDWGEKTSCIIRCSSTTSPTQIEVLRECPSEDAAAMSAVFNDIKTSKSGGGYTHLTAGISSEQSFVRRASLEIKRFKESEYLSEFVISQFKIDPTLNTIALLNAFDGYDFDPLRINPEKDVIFCGLPISEINKIQDEFLQRGLYPQKLELSSISALGAIVDYLKFAGSSKHTLVLELGSKQTQSFIVSPKGVEASRPISVGLDDMVPVVQKELGLKDEESAKKLFFSNTFDFTGMGASLCKRLLKELQSSMGFYEVQTGQSIGQVVCTVLPSKLTWIEGVIASQIGVNVFQPDMVPWLSKRGIGVIDNSIINSLDARKFAVLGLVVNFNSEINAPAS